MKVPMEGFHMYWESYEWYISLYIIPKVKPPLKSLLKWTTHDETHSNEPPQYRFFSIQHMWTAWVALVYLGSSKLTVLKLIYMVDALRKVKYSREYICVPDCLHVYITVSIGMVWIAICTFKSVYLVDSLFGRNKLLCGHETNFMFEYEFLFSLPFSKL